MESLIIEADIIIEVGAFQECTKLSKLTVGGKGTIGSSLFVQLQQFGDVKSSDVLKMLSVIGERTIKPDAFMYCSGITSLILEGVTSIPQSTFDSCSSLKTITIPSGVTSIGKGAFSLCPALDSVTIQGDMITLNSTVFDDSQALKTIYVTTEEVKAMVEEHFAVAEENKNSSESNNEFNCFKNYPTGVTVVNINASEEEDTQGSTDEDVHEDMVEPEFYVASAWIPTAPEDIFRHSLKGTPPSYKATGGNQSINMVSEVQGPLCIDAFNLFKGDYTLARTYNIFLNDSLCYYSEDAIKIVLQIPLELQKQGRMYQMLCASDGGKVYVFRDLDTDPTTITFETNHLYAFALGYMD